MTSPHDDAPHPDSEYLRDRGQALKDGLLSEEEKQDLDKLLRQYHIATKAWLQRHGERE